MTTLVSSSAYRGYLGTGTPDSTTFFRGDGSWQTVSSYDPTNVTITGGTINGTTLGATTPAAGTFNSLNVTGNTTLGDASGDNVTINGASWTWAGSSTRLQADFSNATASNRAIFQSSTTNGQTALAVMPNGTSTQSQFLAYGGTDPTNTNFAQLLNNGVEVSLRSGTTGVASNLPLTFYTATTERVRIDTSGNVVVGTGQLTNGATDGFLYIPGTTSGAPSGTPTSYSGRHPMVVDDTNNRLYINIGGTWRYATLT